MVATIRRAVPADADETAAVFSAAFRSMRFVPKIHSDEEDRGFVRGLIANKECWVAVRDGRILGLACLHNGWLEQLYVDPAHHNTGVGTLLLQRATREHPEGFQLWTFQANAGARRFYERHGCTAVEFTDGSGNEEKTPDVRYEWRPPATQLMPAGDDHFAWMLGEAEGPSGLALPPGGVDDVAILILLRRTAAKLRDRNVAGSWLIVSDGEVVGLCGFKTVPDKGVVEIGYGVATSHRGCGHATRAVAALILEASRDPEIGALKAETAVANIASQHVLERNGFVKSGTRTDPEDGDLIVWSRTLRDPTTQRTA
jgi:RimJ/RimL family protein N-acetyltransferase